MNPKQLLVPGAVIVGGYFLLRPGGLLEQIMGQLGGSAEGGAPMPDPYGYGGATTKPTDEIVRWTDPSPTPTDETQRGADTGGDNYSAPPSQYEYAQGGNPNKASATGQADQDYSIWPAVENVGTAALAAGSALWAAKQLPKGTGTKIGEVGKRAWDIGRKAAPRVAVVGAVAGATALAVGGDSTDWLGLGRLVPWIEGGLSRVGIQKASAAPSTPVLPATPQSTTNAFMNRASGGQGVQTNPNRPSGSSTPFTVTTQGIAPGQLSPVIAAAIKSRGGTVSASSSSSSSSGSTYGGFGLRQVGTTKSGGRVFK